MLVEYEGFKVEWFYERGQLFRFTRLIVLVCALTYHLKRLTGSEESRVEHYFKILRPITRFNLSRRLPRLWWPRHRLGGYIAARKGEFLSFVAIQEAYFKRGGIARPTNE
jgi:hypothetical protein